MDLKSILSPPEDQPHLHPPTSVSLPQPSTPALAVTPSHTNIATPSPSTAHLPVSSAHQQRERAQPGPAVSVPGTRTIGKTTAIGPSSLSHTPLSSLPSHVINPLHQPSSSPLISPVPAAVGSPHALRSVSGQSVETLSDLAAASGLLSQSSRPSPLQGSSLDSAQSTNSSERQTYANSSMTSSNHRASIDINMLETSQQVRRTDFTETSLSQPQKERLAQLSTYIAEQPSAYDSHVAYINFLHQAFIDHVYPSSTDHGLLPKRDPSSFELLSELRTARDTMDRLFAVGESLWLDWLQDESMLATTTEQRIEVIEKFRKAVSEEMGSCKLWVAYGDWLLECHQWAGQTTDTATVDEERLVGREVFTLELLLETWQEAVEGTKHDFASSQLVWNKYIELRISEFKTAPNKEHATKLLGLFEQRLRTPHLATDSTKQILSTFMNNHFSQEQYFEIMEDTPRIMKDALRLLEERTEYEIRIEDSLSKQDRVVEYNEFAAYLEWEKTPVKRRKVNVDICDALYQRAELRFPADSTLWEDHIVFMLDHGRSALDILSRATRHCPWSGSLWSQYLLMSDRQGLSYEDTEAIKHKATSTGVLEAAGISDVLKVHAAWCSYLRRRASRPDHDEDDADIAEIGFRASMENLSSLGAKLGLGNVPDPSFRLQRIYINFLSETGRWDNARREFDNAVCDYGKSWQFWLLFYQWEMKRWCRFSFKGRDAEALNNNSGPQMATAVLKMALDQDQLDYPEPIIEALLNHCEDYEDADELQKCMLRAREIEKALAARRQIEAIQQVQATAIQQSQDLSNNVDHAVEPQLAKRKRELNEDEIALPEGSKRAKTEDDAMDTVEQTKAENPKRNRENATVLVEDLPENPESSKIRQYFSNCGVVKSLKLLDNGTSAVIEFEDDQAAQYALSRNGQQFDDSIISVVLDSGSTIFLTNYAPETSEANIRDLLQPFGEILSVRLPSLQGNKKRRFCYAQFKSPAEAQAAVNGLDGSDVNGLALTCKISNPAVKKSRQEVSINNGQTIFIGGLNFKLSEAELNKGFLEYGHILQTRMPLHETMKTRNKGIAFITFKDLAEAQAALAMNGKNFGGRSIKVEIAQDNPSRPGRRGSSVLAAANGTTGQRSDSPAISATEPRSERTVFLTAVPDTINEARFRQIASKHGNVVKVILKTNHQGALIEYATVSAAGEAALALDGCEIDPGRKIKVVSEKEMLAQKPDKKGEDFVARPKPQARLNSISIPAVIKRPTQPGRKGGKLGQRSIVLDSKLPHQLDQKNAMEVDGTGHHEQAGVRKSNADFRALMKGE